MRLTARNIARLIGSSAVRTAHGRRGNPAAAVPGASGRPGQADDTAGEALEV